MKTKDEFPKTLMDFIRTWGAPNSLFSDNAAEQCSFAVKDILCMYNIGPHQTREPHHQHQNTAEHRIEDIKRTR